MEEASAASQLMDLVRFREQIDQLAAALLPSRRAVFGGISLPLPNVDGSAELAFIRTASWLYVHYFEVGLVSVRFLVRRGPVRSGPRFGDSHLDVVHALRTQSEHNLDTRSESDATVADVCNGWFEEHCGTRVPRTEEHWRVLCRSLLADAREFLMRIRDALAQIEREEGRTEILQQWEDRLNRSWPAHKFHELISVIAADLGRSAIDPVAFYARYGSSFAEGMRLLSDDCDFETEARKLVERAILSEAVSVLPITGTDIMEFFDLPPGKEIGHLLQSARALYEVEPCDSATLLRRVAEARSRP